MVLKLLFPLCLLFWTVFGEHYGWTEHSHSPVSEYQNEVSQEEIEHMALDASRELLPSPELLAKIAAGVWAIRFQHPTTVASVRTNGRWKLGQVDIQNCSPELVQELNASEFGPVKGNTQRQPLGYTRVTFEKHFNPDLLARKLQEKFGVVARGVWKDREPDFGGINYKMADESYTFRQGLASCGTKCTQNNFSVFKFDSSNTKASLSHEFATDIPRQY